MIVKSNTRNIIYEIFLLKIINFPRIVVFLFFFFSFIFVLNLTTRRCDNNHYAFRTKQKIREKRRNTIFSFSRKSSLKFARETRALDQFSIKRVSKWLQRSFLSNSIFFENEASNEKILFYIFYLFLFVE